MIEGSLHNVPLTDVFQVIVTSQKAGILTVIRGVSRARIYFDVGRIQYAHITPGVHLGEMLVRMDLLSAHEVQEILLKQTIENAGTPLGLTAIGMGFLEDPDLQDAVTRQVLEVLTELITWREGSFNFAERSQWASQVPTEHSLDAMALLMKAAQWIREWEAGSVAPESVFQRSGDPTKVRLDEEGWEVLGYVDGKRSARSIAAELDLAERHVYRLLFELLELEVIEEVPYSIEEPLILIISQSSALQRLIRLALQRARLRAHVVVDLENSMSYIRDNHPSAIVVDDVEGAGWEFVRDLRKLPGQGHLPVIVLTEASQNHSQGLFRRFRRPKANVLEKPFHEIEFQQMITQLVGKPLT